MQRTTERLLCWQWSLHRCHRMCRQQQQADTLACSGFSNILCLQESNTAFAPLCCALLCCGLFSP